MASPVSPFEANKNAESGDWRATVPQSKRNAQVRDIARVLATLEPGATEASKLRLAMQFENAVFKQATSFEDYQKKLNKKLKKVQKSYSASQPKVEPATNVEHTLYELRREYGDSIKYILANGDRAAEEIKMKQGAEKSEQLKQYKETVKVWASDLGLLTDKPNKTLSEAQIEKLKAHLQRSINNIRAHVVKYADPDLFLAETLERMEQHLAQQKQKGISSGSSISAPDLLAARTKQLYYQLAQKTSSEAIQDGFLAASMEAASASVTSLTRATATEASIKKQAALKHLEKMRAASSVLLGYLAACDSLEKSKNIQTGKTLARAQKVALESSEYVVGVVREMRKEQREEQSETVVTLEHAWMKSLEWNPEAEVDVSASGTSSTEIPSTKRQRLGGMSRMVNSTRVLLRANRKTPPNLIPAFKRKRAKLVRPSPHGYGTHLILDFGKAFAMRIYLSPLLVNLQALANPTPESVGPQEESKDTWSFSPIHAGLTDRDDLSVWGANGGYCSIGHVVQERLRDASAHATYVLRKCFSSMNIKDNAGDFEIEILEATALLEFLQLVRTTYIPNWEDDDE